MKGDMVGCMDRMSFKVLSNFGDSMLQNKLLK